MTGNFQVQVVTDFQALFLVRVSQELCTLLLLTEGSPVSRDVSSPGSTFPPWRHHPSLQLSKGGPHLSVKLYPLTLFPVSDLRPWCPVKALPVYHGDRVVKWS